MDSQRVLDILYRSLISIKETLLYELFTNKRFMLGFTIFLSIALLGYIGSLFAYPDPWDVSAYNPLGNVCTPDLRFLPPSPSHLLGTDQGCRDIYTWITVGIKNSLWVAALAALISVSIASSLGLIAGYVGGLLDNVINFLSNFMMVIPMFIVLLMVVSYIPPQLRSALLVALMIGLISWPGPTRVVRSMVMQNKALDYVDVAKLMKMKPLEIMFKEILPNIASYIFLIYIQSFSASIFTEVGIGAMGFGPWDAVTLGRAFNNMIAGSAVQLGLWWWFLPLGLIVTFLAYSLLLINIGLQHVFNPRLKLTLYAV